MAAQALAIGLSFITEEDVTSPPPAKNLFRGPTAKELNAIELPDYGLLRPSQQGSSFLPAEVRTPLTVGSPCPKDPKELECSEPSTPVRDGGANIVPSFWYPKMNKFRVMAACLTYFGNGINDSAPGALIPYIESWYHIGYAVVSLIFVTNAIGFIVSAFTTDAITAKIGRARALMTSEAFMAAGYVVIACSPPFPVVVAAYILLGFGNALNIALNNVFCANLNNSTVVLGAAHGSYGVGGIVGPILATTLVSNGVHWARFYIITIALRIITMCAVGWAYRGFEKESATQFNTSLQQIASRQVAAELGDPNRIQLLKRALKDRTTLLGALFIFAYQGGEVSESGWFISYLIDSRNADPAKVGYVTAGFWGGITLGRFVLVHLAPRIGEKRYVFILGAGTIAFQLLSWLVPNIIGDAVAVAIVGLLLGPIYPCGATVFSRLLPMNMQVTSVGLISSAGSSGGAVVPLLTGLLAQVVSTWVLHPVCIASFVVMLGAWALLPRIVKRTE